MVSYTAPNKSLTFAFQNSIKKNTKLVASFDYGLADGKTKSVLVIF